MFEIFTCILAVLVVAGIVDGCLTAVRDRTNMASQSPQVLLIPKKRSYGFPTRSLKEKQDVFCKWFSDSFDAIFDAIFDVIIGLRYLYLIAFAYALFAGVPVVPVFIVLTIVIVSSNILDALRNPSPQKPAELDYDSPQLFEPLTSNEFMCEFKIGFSIMLSNKIISTVLTDEDIQEMSNNENFMSCMDSLVCDINACPRAACRSSYKIREESLGFFYTRAMGLLLASGALDSISEELKQKLAFIHYHRHRAWRIGPPYG